MPDFIPRKDSQMVAWMNRLLAVAEENKELLGLDTETLESGKQAAKALNASFPASFSAQKIALASVVKKNTDREAAETVLRSIAKMVHARPGVPDDLKIRMGLHVNTRSHRSTAPQPPKELGLRVLPSGAAALHWSANGNRPNTIYIVEYVPVGSNQWAMLDASTGLSLKLSHERRKAIRICRVLARRGGETSDPSNVLVVNELEAAA
jgi:hypothetical protein